MSIQKQQRCLTQAGIAALLLLVGLMLALVGLHRIGLINAWQFPLKSVAAFLGLGSLTCFGLSLLLGLRSISRTKLFSKPRWTVVLAVLLVGLNVPAYVLAPKELVISPDAGHHQLIGVDRSLWETTVKNFLLSALSS